MHSIGHYLTGGSMEELPRHGKTMRAIPASGTNLANGGIIRPPGTAKLNFGRAEKSALFDIDNSAHKDYHCAK